MFRKFISMMLLALLPLTAMAQGMSDQQVIQLIASEAKAGTSQAQIVTKLMQKGVKIDQIRRLRNQYDKQISSRGASAAADGAVRMATERMTANSDGTSSQELTTAKRGTTGEVYTNASEEVTSVENEVKATQGHSDETQGKQVYGRSIFAQANPSFAPNTKQEETPAFTTLQSATVPVLKAGPGRAKMCIIFLFLAFLATSGWILYKEDDLKPLLGLS